VKILKNLVELVWNDPAAHLNGMDFGSLEFNDGSSLKDIIFGGLRVIYNSEHNETRE